MKPDISAVGTNVAGATISRSYESDTGTSFSAPLVAGAAALLLEKDSTLTPSELKTAMLLGADFGLSGTHTAGQYEGSGSASLKTRINGHGFGKLNIAKSLELVNSNANPNIVSDTLGRSSPPKNYHIHANAGETVKIMVNWLLETAQRNSEPALPGNTPATSFTNFALEVKYPGGTKVTSNSASQTKEFVFFTAPSTGNYGIKVSIDNRIFLSSRSGSDFTLGSTHAIKTGTPPAPSPAAGSTLSEGFDSLGKWTESGEPDWTAGIPNEGGQPTDHTSANKVAKANNCDSECVLTLTDGIDLSGYSSARLSLWRYVDNSLDSGEYLKVDISSDGGTTWTNAFDWRGGSSSADDTWHKETLNLSGYLTSTNFKVRLVAKMSSGSEDVAVDDVSVSGIRKTTGGGFNPTPSGPDTPRPLSSARTVLSDNFNGLAGWTSSGTLRWSSGSSEDGGDPPGHPSGNKVAKADNCDSECVLTLKRGIDLSGYSSASLSFWRYVDRSLDTGEYLKVDVSSNGGTTWVNAFDWQGNRDDDDTWHKETLNLSGYLTSTDFKVRLVAKMSRSSEDVAVDDITITGTRGSADTVAPTITAPADITAEATGPRTTVSLGSAVATDAVDSAPTVTNNAPTTFPLGRTTVTWTATDDAGNSASDTQTVTVRDTTAPTITAPSDVTAEATGSATLVRTGAATAADTVDSSVTITSDAPSSFRLGATTVTWTATDDAGNSATATQTVTVQDTTAPTITAPSDITAEATGTTTPVRTGAATASDTVDSSVTVTSDAPASFPLGSTTVTWTATDDAGNSATATQTVTVQDTTAPSVTAPADATLEATAPLTPLGAAQYGTATASDAADSSVTVTSDAPASFPLGDTTITWTATDSSGNSATDAQTVTVQDTTAPSVTAPNNAVEEAVGTATPVLTGTASASDAVDSSPTITSDAPATFPLGTTTITWTATDDAGNSGTDTQTVTVRDTTPPAITAPGDVTVEATDLRTPVVLGTATATDTVDPSVDVSNDAPWSWNRPAELPSAGETGDEPAGLTSGTDRRPEPARPAEADRDAPPGFPLGTTTVTWTATDDSDNSATDTQTVTVQDTTPPLVSAPLEAVLEATGALTPFGLGDYGEATVTDNSGQDIAVSSSAPELFQLGLTVIVYSATDSSGNTGIDVQSVWVGDTTPPVIAVPETRTFEATGPLTELGPGDYGTPEITDAFGFSASNDAPASFPLGTTVITHSATDAYANSATAEQTVVLADTTPPGFAAPETAHIVVSSASDTVEFDVPPAADLVDGAVPVSCDPSPGARLGLGTATVVCTAADGSGNSSTVSFDVEVSLARSGAPPVIVPPPDAVFEATGMLTPLSSLDYGSATATDGDGGTVTVSSDAPAAFQLGATVITYTATAAGGLGTGATQVITVRDTTPPAITAPADATFEATYSQNVRLGTATAVDSVDPAPTVSNDAPIWFPAGRTTVTWTATDLSGNSATDTQTITLINNTPPEIRVYTPDEVTVTAYMVQTDTPSYMIWTDRFARMFVDNSYGISERSIKPDLVPLGTTVLYYSATDTSGNSTTVSKPVTLVKTKSDGWAPAFPAPADVVLSTFSSSAAVSYSTMTVWDYYDPSPSVTCDPPSGSVFQRGTSRVDCSVSDDFDNVRLRHFYVLVEPSDATRTLIYENGFDSGLGDVYHKELRQVYDETSRTYVMASPATSVYSLSHSEEAGGSAHIKYNRSLQHMSTGVAAEFSVAPGTATSTLVASFDYRGLAALQGYLGINHVNHMHFTISDSQGRLLDLGKPLTGREPGSLSDTGWRSVTAVVPQVGPALCPCELYMYTGDAWGNRWKKQLYLDNVVIEMVPAPPPGASGQTAMSSLGRGAEPPNLLTVNELLTMQFYDDPKVVIVEKRAHDDSVLISWDHDDWAREYKVVIRPASDPSAKFADIASGGANSYRFVNLIPGTDYVVSVGERGDDTTQASVNVRTPEAGTHPFDPGLYVEAWQDGSTARLWWTDYNGAGEGRYRVERSVDGGPFIEIEKQPGSRTETTDGLDQEWSGKQVTYRVFEWVGKQKLYSDEVSFVPQ